MVETPPRSTGIHCCFEPALKLACFIGQAPGRHGQKALAGRSGNRLCTLAGLPHDKLFMLFDRRNVFRHFPGRKSDFFELKGDFFDVRLARKEAQSIDVTAYRLVVFLGLNVAKAFNIRNGRLFKELRFGEAKDTLGIILPHPSGVSHFWNAKENRRVAAFHLRRMMSKAGIGTFSKYFTRVRRRRGQGNRNVQSSVLVYGETMNQRLPDKRSKYFSVDKKE